MSKLRRLSYSLLIISGLVVSHSSFSAPLYRFIDEEGTPTVSRSLPPHIAPQGYDILDDKTMRVIETVPPVPTEAELVEQARQQQLQDEQLQQANEAARAAAESRRQQQIRDRNLLATYQSENELITARNADLLYRRQRIERISSTLPKLQNQLLEQQQLAAEAELSGRPVSENLRKRINALQQEIANNQRAIDQQEQELEQREEEYEAERLRLLELLSRRNR